MEKSAGIVLVNHGKYLLLKYGAGHYDFPKGHLEANETPEQAAKRELKEETGISADIIPGFSTTIKYFFRAEGKPIAKEVTFFLAKTNEIHVTLSKEHTDFTWLSYEDALTQLTFDTAKDVLRKAHDWLLTNDKTHEKPRHRQTIL